jgi:hypothetical protein
MKAGPVELGSPTVAPRADEANARASTDVPPGELLLEAVPPTPEALSFDDVKPAPKALSFDDVKPAPEALSFAEVTGPETAPVPAAPACATPRTPTLAVGPSIGTYRMLRPSEPDVFTPPPTPSTESRTPGPTLKRAGATHPHGAQPPSLSLNPKPGRGDPNRTPTPATIPRPQPAGSAPRPTTPAPTPHKGTLLGMGPGRRRG